MCVTNTSLLNIPLCVCVCVCMCVYVTNMSLLNIPLYVRVCMRVLTRILWKKTKYWKRPVDYKMDVDKVFHVRYRYIEI